ncbi:MAG: alpha/beta fold hydrolase [Bdellovibrionales bacterium]|nr:alpha/beta fold hydrolase [Bdellovibrionales bacterium]
MLHILWTLLSLSLFADINVANFQTARGVPTSLQEAKSIHFTRPDGIILKGFTLGAKNSNPVVLVPGYFSSAAYYGDVAAILANNGMKPYAYSLAGQGQGELRSGYSRQRQDYPGQFSFDRHINDLIAFIEAVYQIHKKPVILVGHSLGGLLVRAVSTGPDIKDGSHKISPQLRAKLQRMVAKGIVVNSPSPVISKLENFDLSLSLSEKWKIAKGQFIILNAIPVLAKLTDNPIFKEFRYRASSLPLANLVTSIGLRAADFVLSDVVMSADFHGSNVADSFSTAASERLEKDTVNDLKRFITEGFTTREGLDIATAYLNQNTAAKRFPITIISGSKDILGLERFNTVEASHLGYPHIINGMTHMSGFFGASAPTLAEIILTEINPKKKWDLTQACQLVF